MTLTDTKAATRGAALGHVLVVDDEEDVRLLCQINLTLAGYSVTEVSGGGELLQAARKHRPDVILLDLSMPDGNGWDRLAELRADDELRAVPVAIMSGSDTNDDHSRGDALGVRTYVTKPFSPNGLIEAVRLLTEEGHRRWPIVGPASQGSLRGP